VKPAVLLFGALALTLAPACAPRRAPGVAPVATTLRFQVLGNASPSDSGAPTLRLAPRTITIRGMAIQVEGAGLYGDLDVTQPHTVRLTLYDSLPGRPVQDPPPPSQLRQVVYQAEIGPLAPGPYDVWVGRYDARQRVVEVLHEPLHIEVEPGSAEAGEHPEQPGGVQPDSTVEVHTSTY
jgi:hypothetical protein